LAAATLYWSASSRMVTGVGSPWLSPVLALTPM